MKSDNFVAKTRDCRDSLYNVVINGINNDTIVLTIALWKVEPEYQQ